MTDQQCQKTASATLCCLRDTEEACCRVPLPHPQLPLWHEPFNLDFFLTKQYFHQTARRTLVVCTDVAINLPLPANRDLSQGSMQKSNTTAATLNPIARRDSFILNITFGIHKILDVCFILQENRMGAAEIMTSARKSKKSQVNIVMVS